MNYTLGNEYSDIIQFIYGDSKDVLIYFETRNNSVLDLEFECVIGDSRINSSLMVINQTQAIVKSIRLPLHQLVQVVPFGNHSMNMTLYAQNRTEVRSIVVWLLYEVEITGLEVRVMCTKSKTTISVIPYYKKKEKEIHTFAFWRFIFRN